MAGPGYTGRPTTGELQVALEKLEETFKESQDKISETRKSLSNVERMIGLMNERWTIKWDQLEKQLEKRFMWMEKLALAAVIGVGGVFLQKLWELVRAP